MVRIGTWNLENLFQPGSPGGPAADAYDAKLDALAATITQMEPDILAVQEVGDPAALTDLANRVGGAWHTETAHPDGRGIRVGFLSRIELTGVTPVAEFPNGLRPIQVDDTPATIHQMGRPALRVQIRTAGGNSIDLVSCHLKSKLLTFPGGRFSTHDEGLRARFAAYALFRRAAEAVTVRAEATALLDGHGQDRAVVVLGDFNDEPAAATTQILLGPPGSEIGTGGFGQPDQGDAQRLWNLAALIPADNRFSRIYRGNPELIDHIFASDAVTKLVKPGDIDFHGARPASINDTPRRASAEPGSDHRPLLLNVDL
jgi:endonuclease/exonuclease/phosphatase family metal-dependent hydrolase